MDAPKKIALFIDGTWDQPNGAMDTNVRKLFEACRFVPLGPLPQLTYYMPGVGTDIGQSEPGAPVGSYGGYIDAKSKLEPEIPSSLLLLRPFLGGVFGRGTAARIKEAYAYLSWEYDQLRGDSVFVFGFSRGAFAARSLAGFISRVGILLRHKLEYVEEAYRLYEADVDGTQSHLAEFLARLTGQTLLQSGENAGALRIHFIGVWDTVGALGLPWRLTKFTANYTEHHQTEIPPNVMTARHALALHELRKPFDPLLWSDPHGHAGLRQVWFAGAHADIGGGYPLHESGLANNALRWMANEAQTYGLQIEPTTRWLVAQTSAEVLHHQVRKWFIGLTPRIRPQLKMLRDASGGSTGALGHALFFHESTRLHLLNPAARQYKFRRPGVNRRLHEVDELALQLFIQSRLVEQERNGKGRSKADPSARPPERWWQSVTLEELGQASAVIDAFTGESPAPVAVTPGRFARALALHLLCVDAEIVDQLIARADARNAALVHALELDKDGRGAGIEAYTSWLARRGDIAVGLKECAALLSTPLRLAVGAKADRFIHTSTEHRNVFFSILFGLGLQTPTTAPPLASFLDRAPDPKKAPAQ